MKELKEKYKKWHGQTDHDWKIEVIKKADDNINFIDYHLPIDWLYDDALDYIFYKSTTKIKNLAKKLGYEEPPCTHCKNIIKYWHKSKEIGFLWNPENDHLFKKDKHEN